MTREQLNKDNTVLRAMIAVADEEVLTLGKSDLAWTARAMWRWVDRRAALTLALEAVE